MPLNPLMTHWPGRVAWLVGASTGIGRALAVALHALGARVVVSARPSAALDGLAAQCPGLQTLALDVTDAAAAQAVCNQLLAQHGRLDVVLLCAGTYRPMRATHFQLDVAQHHLAVNYGGALNVLAAVLPVLLAQAQAKPAQPAAPGVGHIALVASVAGYRALPKALAYGPTKAALIHLAQALHLDLAPLGLGVSLINPGFVATPLTAQNDFHMPALLSPEQAAQAILQGWARGAFEIHFPRRFSLMLKVLGWLPTAWYEALLRRSTGL